MNNKKTGRFLKCNHCGKEVYVPQNRLSSFKYCSRKCLALANVKKETIKCCVCGKMFDVISTRANKAKYCSKECYYKAMNKVGTKEFVCLNCGDVFLSSPSKDRKFCSNECKTKYRLKNFFPKTASCIQKYMRKRNMIRCCDICGYKEHPEILGIHHKDRNRNNNSIENLQILCPICHSIEHKKTYSSRRF